MIDNISILLQRRKTKAVAPGADARFNLSLFVYLHILSRVITGFVVSVLSFLLTSGFVGCSFLSHTSGFDSEQYVFPGLSSLGVRASGKFVLSWAAVPDTEVVYSVYTRDAASLQSYDFSADPLLRTSETLVETRAFPLNENRCFVVRFKSQLSTTDANVRELCSSDDGVVDFQGVDTVTSTIAGQVTVSWVKSVNPAVTGYRVYQGNGFQKNVGEAEASANRITLTGFAAGERLEFGVRAYDRFGREDANVTTVLVEVSDAEFATGSFAGCESATPLDINRIRVSVVFPAGASSMKVYRDSVLVGTLSAGNTSIIDSGLREGGSYTYTCHAAINGIPTIGTAEILATTPVVNPPGFAGVESVSLPAAGQALLTWSAPAGGGPVAEYRVYMIPGSEAPVVGSATLLTTITDPEARETTISNLGDELRYSFRVVACTATNLCAGQAASLTSDTLTDAGIPLTLGATQALMSQGSAVITAPWTHNMGAVGKRRIYMSSPAVSSGINIDGRYYELVRTEVVSDRYNPPTKLTVTGLVGGTTYYFIVRDEDTQSPPNVSQNTAVVSVQSGDIDPPLFTGIGELLAGANAETELLVRFVAVASESVHADGPSQYLVYQTTSVPQSIPGNPCAAAASVVQINASNYAANDTVELTLSGLSSRQRVSVCVKARDTAGNVSNTTTYITALTQDRTAPLFDGIQTFAYNNVSEKLELRWNQATSASNDVGNYRVTLWRCAAGTQPDCSATGTSVVVTASGASGADFARTVFTPALLSNEMVSVRVNSCDNAAPDYASVNNCTTTTRIRSVTMPDVTPPPGFSGIVSAAVVSGTEGALRAVWTAPADWSDYRGFKIYSAGSDQSLTLLKDCTCSAVGCPLQPTSCNVTGLSARRTYHLFVRAYDAAGNHTALPNSPYAVSRAATTLDLTAPSFASNLTASFDSSVTPRGVRLSWSAATDNQYSQEAEATITYKVYRKVGGAFTGLSATTPPSDGSLLTQDSLVSYFNTESNLTANTTEYYAVCAVDASDNTRCDSDSVRLVSIPRLNPPVFAGIESLTLGGAGGINPDTSLSLGFSAVVSETTDQANGATDYAIYTLDVDGESNPANACTSTNPVPVFKGAIPGTAYSESQDVTYILSGLTPRRKYSVCLKARDSVGGESATTTALTAVTRDVTAPVFSGLTSAVYDGNTRVLNLTWTNSTSTDVRHYRISLWKNSVTPQNVVTLVRTPVAAAGQTETTQIGESDFALVSNDTVYSLVDVCDTAAPTYGANNNCTAFPSNSARVVSLPDVDAPLGFAGILSAVDTSPRAGGKALISWVTLSDGNWADVRGFKIYHVEGESPSLLKTCACTAYGCPERLQSCEVSGLNPGRTYRFYVRAYDAAGNLSAIFAPNPITNVQTLRVADTQAPSFTSSLTASYSGEAGGIVLAWNAAVDDQYAPENTLGYRLYRKEDSTFSATTRATIAAEGTQLALSANTARSHTDPLAGLADGRTYYYTVCAFDADTGAAEGNTTCDGSVRSVTLADTTAPEVANLAGSESEMNIARPSFALTWSLADNTDVPADLFVIVRRKVSASNATDFPATDAVIYDQGYGLTSLTGEQGPAGQFAWITYRVSVRDLAANLSHDATFAIASYRAPLTTVVGDPDYTLVNSAQDTQILVSYSGNTTVLAEAEFLAKVSLLTTGTASCSKGVSGVGVTNRTVTLSGCTGDGTVQVTLAEGTATGDGGNLAPAASSAETITVDNTPPVVGSFLVANGATDGFINAADVFANQAVATLMASGYTSQSYAVVDGATALCNSGFTYSYGLIPTAGSLPAGDGVSKTLCARLADNAGNITYALLGSSINIDNVAPTPPAVTSAAAATQNLTPTWSWTSGGGGNGTFRYRLSNSDLSSGATETTDASYTSGSDLSETAHTLYVQERDAAGNWSASGSFAVTVDVTPPTAPTVTSAAAATQNLTPTWSWTSGGGGNGTFRYKLNQSDLSSGATVTTNASYTPGSNLSEAAHTLYVQERDAAGNWSASGSFAVTVDVTPPNAPVVSGESPSSDRTPTWSWTSGGGGSGAFRYKFNDGDLSSGATDTSAYSYVPASDLTDGDYVLYVQERDAAGNWSANGSRQISIVTPPTPPVINEDPPSPLLGLSLALTGTCDSSAGFEHSVTTTVGSVLHASCADSTLRVNLNFPEGRREVTVTVINTNTANGGTASDSVTFTQQFFCPKGYVGVPGKFASDTDVAGLGNASATAIHADAGLNPTRDFCVMKYPAKVATSSHGGQTPWEPIYDGNKDFITGADTTIMENYWPESRAHSTPWVNITRDEALDRCKALNEAYGLCTGSGCYSAFDNAAYGYRLLSNTQWQVIARNLEKTGDNWTGGTHMSGYLYRGQTDDAVGSNTDLHTQTFVASSQRSLSHPRLDSGSDYFGTGNNATQNTSGTAGWQERRRFVLSNGISLWDMAGNVWQWVSDNRADLGITTADDEAGMSSTSSQSYLNGAANRFSATGNLIFGNFGNGGLQFSEAVNAGKLYSGSAGAVHRGGGWSSGSTGGLFAARLSRGPAYSSGLIGFRCAFPGPSLPLDPLDSGAPTVGAVERRDNWGVALASNNPVTVGAGGVWHLGWTVDDELNEVGDWQIYVQVRRKIADADAEGDFPAMADTPYKEDFNLTSLKDETAWVLDEGTGRYTRNDGRFVNYLVTAIDPHGNTHEQQFSVEVTQSCPPGFVGVQGGAVTNGLGHVNAKAYQPDSEQPDYQPDQQLDPTLDFCIMKHPAKVMSAGTTAAQDAVGGVGGKFEPILNGNGTFTNDYTYANAPTFDSKVKYLPESRPEGTPWVNISRDNSIKACQALQMQYFGTMPDTANGTGFQLLSNTQWQVAARSMEATITNWSNNVVGSGVLNRGHTDNGSFAGAGTNSWNMGSGSLALPGSVSDTNSYFGTGNTVTNSWPLLVDQTLATGDEQKRTFNLSNGATLWDMAGNVWQWVTGNNASTRTADDMGVSDVLRGSRSWLDYNGVMAGDLLLFGSAGGYTSTQNAGKLFGGFVGAVRRGGNWYDSSNYGLFAADLFVGPTNSGSSIGFRCAFQP